MDINTINELLLPAFLFTVVFCFLCCQKPYPTVAGVEKDDSVSVSVETESVSVEATPDHKENVPVIDTYVTVVPKPVQNLDTVHEQALAVINGLSKVQLRKLCLPLGIQQKRNGVELTKQLMTAAIKKSLRANEELVIQAIDKRLNIKIGVAEEIQSIASA